MAKRRARLSESLAVKVAQLVNYNDRRLHRKDRRRRVEVVRPPSSGGGLIRFQITDAAECGTGQVTALVENLPCKGSPVSIGDSITVKDKAGCFFDVEPAFLLGIKGYCTQMLAEEDDAGTGTSTGTGEAAAVTGCQYEVISLCCTFGGCA